MSSGLKLRCRLVIKELPLATAAVIAYARYYPLPTGRGSECSALTPVIECDRSYPLATAAVIAYARCYPLPTGRGSEGLPQCRCRTVNVSAIGLLFQNVLRGIIGGPCQTN